MATLPTSWISSFITQTDFKSTNIVFFDIVNTHDDEIVVGYSIDEYISALLNHHVTNVFIHDFNYMASYIIDYVLKNNFVYNPSGSFKFEGDVAYNLFRDDDGHCYYIKLFFKTVNGPRSCEFKSSKNKTMSSVSSMYKSFGLKIDTDINIDNISDSTKQLNAVEVMTDNMMEEAIISSLVVAGVIKKLKKVGYNKLTIGSDALRQWIRFDGDFSYLLPRLDEEVDNNLRLAYRGGFTWINPIYKNKETSDGIVLDINSLYPFIMRNFDMPVGVPVWTTGQPGPDDYFVCHIAVTATLKPNHIPCISNINNSISGATTIIVNEYLENLESADIWLTNFDFELLTQNYDIEALEYYGAYVFKKQSGMFDTFIDVHYEIKRQTTGAKRQLSKLMLDSLYGRFGIKTNKKTTVPSLIDNKLVFNDGKTLEDRTLRYLPIAIFITSIARWAIISDALDIFDRLIYVDTDSLHLVGTDIPEGFDISDKLGDYKIEAIFKKALYVGLKTYIHDEIINDKVETVVKMSGAPDTVKKHVGWHNFASGTVVPGKYYVKTVPGGFIRCETTFKITSI